MRNLLSDDPAMLLREQMGISADGSEKAYRNDDTEAFFKRQPTPLVYNFRDNGVNVNHIFCAVDPSGGGPSAFSICTIIVLSTGAIQVTLLPNLADPTYPLVYLSSLLTILAFEPD